MALVAMGLLGMPGAAAARPARSGTGPSAGPSASTALRSGGTALPAGRTAPAQLPSGLQTAIDRALASQPVSTPGGLRLSWGRGGQVSFALSKAPSVAFSLRPVALEGSRSEAFAPGPFVFGAKQVTEALARGVSAWYKASVQGFEQGFTVSRPPAGASRTFLLVLSYAGALHPRPAGAQGFDISGPAGAEMTYGGLHATDATGRALSAHLVAAHGALRITVNAAGATYPVRIDPFVAPSSAPTATFSGTGGDALGYSVALSADGQTALVGPPGAVADNGAAYLYTEASGTWPATPTASFAGSGTEQLGYSVALSADGQTALVGAPLASSQSGAAFLYAEASGKWPSSPTASFTGSGAEVLGTSVALSADGQTALVGAPYAGTDKGAAYLYAETSGNWPSPPTASFTGSGNEELGYKVALSADGQTALAGAWAASSGNGAAYLYSETSGTWPATPTASFTGSGGEGLGSSVAIAGDGQTALVGAPNAASGNGAAYVYDAVPLFVDAAVSGSQAYGSSAPRFSFTDNAPSGVGVSGSATCSEVETATAVSASLAVGTYTLEAGTCSGLSLGGAGASSYALSYNGGPFVVSPAPLSITATSATMTEGAPVPPITPSYGGFVLGQGPSALSVPPTCSTTATSSSPPGTYPATCSGAEAAGYSISYAPGTVTVLGPSATPPATATPSGPPTPAPPSFPDAPYSYPNGALVNFRGSYYVFAGGRAFGLTASQLAKLQGVDHAKVLDAPPGALAPTTAPVRPGTMVTTSSVDANPTIYVQGTDGALHGFASLHQFLSGGFDPALVVSLGSLGNAPVSALSAGAAHLDALSTASDGALVISGHTWYVLAGGRAFGIPTPGQLLALRQADGAEPVAGNLSASELAAPPADGVLVSVTAAGVYVAYQGQLFGFKTMSQLLADGYGGSAAVPVPGPGGLPVVFPYSGS